MLFGDTTSTVFYRYSVSTALNAYSYESVPGVQEESWTTGGGAQTAADSGLIHYGTGITGQVGAGKAGDPVAHPTWHVPLNLATEPGGTPTFTPGAGITSIACASGYTCTNTKGELTIVSATGGTGTIGTVSFSQTLAVKPGLCMVTQNVGAPYWAVGHGAASVTGFTIESGVAPGAATSTVDYYCIP